MPTTKLLSQEIGDTLRDEILRQRYRSGERLPSERDLAARFAASRGAVREALSQLEQLGLIQVQPGGARVKPIAAASIGVLGPLMAVDELPDPELVDQFLQTFGALSGVTARAVVNSGDQEKLNQVRGYLVDLKGDKDATNAMSPGWRVLLESLSEIADNLVVRLIGNDLKEQFVKQMTRLEMGAEIDRKTVDQIIAAMKRSLAEGDGDLAAQAVQRYFDALRQSVSQHLQGRLQSYRRQAV